MRAFRVLVATTRARLYALAGDEWTILENTVKEFSELSSDNDERLGDIGYLVCNESGWLALAYKEE
jgi:hypothetical protein